jgi:membrane associated rhomboid family serine protease
MVALVLLTLTMVAGIAGVNRWSTESWPRSVITFLHRNVALLAAVFLAIHIATAVMDPYVSIGWLAAAVPFVSGWDSLSAPWQQRARAKRSTTFPAASLISSTRWRSMKLRRCSLTSSRSWVT